MKQTIGLALLLIVLTCLVYVWPSRSLRGEFLWCDDHAVVENPLLRDSAGLGRIWTLIFHEEDAAATEQYYPLSLSGYWLQWQAFGDDPFGYRVVNLLFHIANGFLLWALLGRLGVGGAWWGAVLFLVHPIQVESVAWIYEFKNVLSTFWLLLAVYGYLRFDADRGEHWYGLATGCFVFALLSKTAVAVAPLLLLFLVWWRHGRIGKRDLALVAPWFVLAAAMSAVTIWYERTRLLAAGADWPQSLAERLQIAGVNLWFYLSKIIWPMHLSFAYPRWSPADWGWKGWLPIAAVVAVSLILLLVKIRSRRGLILGLGVFVISLLPVLGFFNIYMMRYSFVSDHFAYFAVAGVTGLVGAFLAMRPKGRVAGITLVVVLCGLSSWRALKFQESETLWRDADANYPDSWLTQARLGLILKEQGDQAGAIERYEKSLAIHESADAHNNLGNLMMTEGRIPAAVMHLKRAIRLDRGNALAYFNLADAFAKAGQLDDAVDALHMAIAIQPDFEQANQNLEALKEIRESRKQPIDVYGSQQTYEQAHRLYAAGQLDEAIELYRKAWEQNPGHADAGLAIAYFARESGNDVEAVNVLDKVLNYQPLRLDVWERLAWYLATSKDSAVRDPERAIALAEQVCMKTEYVDPAGLRTLAECYLAAGRLEEAREMAIRARRNAARLSLDVMVKEIDSFRLRLDQQR